MKSAAVIIIGLFLTSLVQAQESAIDDIFNKYSGREGFAVVTISGKMFSLFTDKDQNKTNSGDLLRSLNSIRILTVEDTLLNRNINFYRELSSKVNLNKYEELMSVKEGGNMTRFLIKQNGDIISELLVVAGGPGDNTLISIRGNLDLKTISELSKNTGMDELKELDGLDSKDD